MKEAFRGYFAYDKDTFDSLWANAIFTVDTCALLDLYRLHKSSADLFLAALNHVKDRVWLPYQTSKEFFKNYDSVTAEQFEAYEKLTRHLSKMPESVIKEVERHPLLPLQDFRASLDEVTKKMISRVNEICQSHDSPDIDGTLLELDALFAGKMGKEPDEVTAQQLNDICKARFAKKSPPGYLDGMKEGDGKYGDALIWLELIDLAKSQDKDIIFITSEKKADWFRMNKSKEILGPRRELIQEMYATTKRLFYIYRPDSFVERLESFFSLSLPRAKSEITLADDLASVDRERQLREWILVQPIGNALITNTMSAGSIIPRTPKSREERAQSVLQRIEAYVSSLEPTVDRIRLQAAQLGRIRGYESYHSAIEDIRRLADNPHDKRTVKKIYDEIARLRKFYSECITQAMDARIVNIQSNLVQREYDINNILSNLEPEQVPEDPSHL